jgi:hypothetical protein
MTGRRPSHFGDRLRILPKGVASGGGVQGVHAHTLHASAEDAFKVAETHSFVDFSDPRLMCQGKQFNSTRAHLKILH